MTATYPQRSIFLSTARALFFCTSLTLASSAVMAANATDDEDVNRFYSEGYNICDAKLLANFWQEDSYAAKITAGAKMRINDLAVGKQLIEDNLVSARQSGTNPCSWQDADLPGSDLDALAKFWGISIEDSKTKAEDFLFKGELHVLRQIAESARN